MSTRAEIELPDGTRARLNGKGEWDCDDGKWAGYLGEIAATTPGRFYLPDPWEERLQATVDELGARVLSETPAELEPVEGLLH